MKNFKKFLFFIFGRVLLLEKTRSIINSNNLTSENVSLEIAEWVKQTPVIYYPRGLNSVATRFKNSLQENAKIHVINEELLESCHNGIVPWKENESFGNCKRRES